MSNHPGHLVYLLDLSESMEKNGRIDHLLEAVKVTADSLIEKCYRGDVLSNRFSISILGYNTDVYTLFKGSVIELDKILEEVYIQGGEDASLFDKTKEARPKGRADMAKAFHAAAEDIREWMITQQRYDIPMPAPIVVHITDCSTSKEDIDVADSKENILQAAEEIKQISIPDGNPILFNILVEDEIWFPSQRPNDAKKQLLYETSSVFPERIVQCPPTSGFPLPSAPSNTLNMPVPYSSAHSIPECSNHGCCPYKDCRLLVSDVIKNMSIVGQMLSMMTFGRGGALVDSCNLFDMMRSK